jgi:hypothetical protein
VHAPFLHAAAYEQGILAAENPNSNIEIRNKFKIRNSRKTGASPDPCERFEFGALEFVSDFDIRISSF